MQAVSKQGHQGSSASFTIVEGLETGQELGYLPFARRGSRTFVMHVGRVSIVYEDQWLDGYWDDAKADNVGYGCYRPSLVYQRFRRKGLADTMAIRTFRSRATPQQLVGDQDRMRYTLRSTSDQIGSREHSEDKPNINLENNPQQTIPQSVVDQLGNNGSEAVLEIPSPKAWKQKPRKPSKSWSPNGRTSRMMEMHPYDMTDSLSFVMHQTMVNLPTCAVMDVAPFRHRWTTP
ncbi:MAG: hypothetical protein J3Q66DRAFT_438612 [Benniella sp.]|nr:MAG: hypothetical protein J3Q66DRAFT_438612 [Benniella sp.]